MPREDPLPVVFQGLAGEVHNVHRKNDNEYSSSCPKCGGTDRFKLWLKNKRGNTMGHCRQCNYSWFPNGETAHKATGDEIFVDDHRQKMRAANLVKFVEVAPHIQFNQLLGDRGRLLWYDRGVMDELIDYYKLGYCPNYKLKDGSTSEALTIPCYDNDWKCTQIYYRLLKPDAGGKYRQHFGLAPALFIADPDESIKKIVILVEGQIKAIITMETLFGEEEAGEALDPVLKYIKDINVVAVPSCTPSKELIEPLKDAKHIFVCFDPDTYHHTVGNKEDGETPIQRIVRMLKEQGNKDVRELRLWDKIDDMILKGNLDAMDIIQMMKTAIRR